MKYTINKTNPDVNDSTKEYTFTPIEWYDIIHKKFDLESEEDCPEMALETVEINLSELCISNPNVFLYLNRNVLNLSKEILFEVNILLFKNNTILENGGFFEFKGSDDELGFIFDIYDEDDCVDTVGFWLEDLGALDENGDINY